MSWHIGICQKCITNTDGEQRRLTTSYVSIIEHDESCPVKQDSSMVLAILLGILKERDNLNPGKPETFVLLGPLGTKGIKGLNIPERL